MNKPILMFFILFLVGCKLDQSKLKADKTLPYYEEATFTPRWLSPNDASLKKLHKVSDFNFLNQDGDTVSLKTFEDKIYVTDFFFTTCPGICPKMTANFELVQEAFKNEDDVLLLSHSVTPSRDSVPVLKAFAKEYNAISGKWHLVTGDRKEIYNMGRSNYFVEEDLGLDKDPDEFLHTENFILIDRNKHLRGIYNGINKTSVNHLIQDIKLLLREGEER